MHMGISRLSLLMESTDYNNVMIDSIDSSRDCMDIIIICTISGACLYLDLNVH